MDIKSHELALQNIRNKYAQATALPRKGSISEKNTLASALNDLYKTPTKLTKKDEPPAKPKPEEKPQQPVHSSKPTKMEQFAPSREGLQAILTKKLAFSKEKERSVDEILTEREKQLTERVERNKQLLSKSKEVRERESRNSSLTKPETPAQDSQQGINELKLVLKDRNYAIPDKTHKPQTQKKPNSIGLQAPKEDTYASIKKNFTDKMKQNIAENFSGGRTREQTALPEREWRGQRPDPAKNSEKKGVGRQQSREACLIKTPIPPPKESSPSKVASIFANTQKIEQRIHALLSR